MSRLDRGVVSPATAATTSNTQEIVLRQGDPVQGYTYFFRERSAITTIIKKLVPLCGKQQAEIASVGCSTGEEVYSLLVLCRLNGFGSKVRVDGYDYVEERLRIARDGVYEYKAPPQHPSKERQYREAMMKLLLGGVALPPVQGDIAIPPDLKDRASFVLHNIATKPLPRRYPIIICANVLYHYFEKPEEVPLQIVLGNLARSIEPGGFLVCEGKGMFRSESDYVYRRELESYPAFIPRDDLSIPFYVHELGKLDAARVLQRRAR